jgi:hypothetical protein
MVMQEQSRRLAEPLRWGARQKAVIAVVLGLTVVAVVVLAVRGVKSHNGAEASNCVRVTFASTLGGADLHGCGAQARRICASGSFPHVAKELQLACERAGFPYRAPS